MALFPIRLNRIKTNFEVLVHLQENNPRNVLNDNLVATAVNVSKGGACLIFPKIFLNGVHLFFSTLRNDTHTLILRCTNSTQETNGGYTILAQSVWMDSHDMDDGPAFKVGVRFIEKQKDLYDSLKKVGYSNQIHDAPLE